MITIIMMMKCKRCGGTWDSRVVHPRYCPLCKSPKWDVPRSVDALVREAAKGAPAGVDRVDVYLGSGSKMGSAAVPRVQKRLINEENEGETIYDDSDEFRQ